MNSDREWLNFVSFVDVINGWRHRYVLNTISSTNLSTSRAVLHRTVAFFSLLFSTQKMVQNV